MLTDQEKKDLLDYFQNKRDLFESQEIDCNSLDALIIDMQNENWTPVIEFLVAEGTELQELASDDSFTDGADHTIYVEADFEFIIGILNSLL